MSGTPEAGGLELLGARADHSWLRELVADPETAANAPNHESRQVRSGHFVRVKPTLLRKPKLVAVSPRMPRELGLTDEACRSDAFVRYFSGDSAAGPGGLETWTTPYALSIFGQEMYDNCPFKNGNGYGDGRALSVGEVVVGGRRWEMQLKGGGRTPFCRGADGRAVLRSSVREFLASEAMASMGVESTRALSLVVSQEDKVQRPWYDNSPSGPKGAILADIGTVKLLPDDQVVEASKPLLAQLLGPQRAAMVCGNPGFDAEDAREVLQSLAGQLQQPDKMQVEPCAITCRVASSFLRVGHVELHGRRARKTNKSKADVEHLELIVKHALMREFSEVDDSSAAMEDRVLILAKEVSKRLCRLMANWLRVGYCQGNFNSDNCLLAGRTMDYGPFGFMEEFDPNWNMWTGGGRHFSFMNQPQAAHKNFVSLVTNLMPLAGDEGKAKLKQMCERFPTKCEKACNDMWLQKLGLESLEWDETTEDAVKQLFDLMGKSAVDWTILWRQLAVYPAEGIGESAQDSDLLAVIEPAFYRPLPESQKKRWCAWLKAWLNLLGQSAVAAGGGREGRAAAMRGTSPKYVPREWMLVEAYTAASRGDYGVVKELQELFDSPFAEQPQKAEKYYRRAPTAAKGVGGTAFMS